MRILLSNDDGIRAKGIKYLYQLLCELGHEVYIFAPENQSSGISHAVTLITPLVPRKTFDGEQFYGMSVPGTPTDAVKMGLALLSPSPDIVVSGMNLGHNAGAAAYYSGTLAAAFEGMIAGKPAFAFSFDSFHEPDLDTVPARLRPFMASLLQLGEAGMVCSINIPHAGAIKGIRITRQHQGYYHDKYEERTDPRGRKYYWLTGNTFSAEPEPLQSHPYPTELKVMDEGYISVTPLKFDLTGYAYLDALQQRLSQMPPVSLPEKRSKPRKTQTGK